MGCPQCGVQVYGSTNLVDHMASRHPPSNITVKHEHATPTCSICHEAFVTNQALKYHLYKHTGLKPYKCKVCGSFFRTPSTLKSHVEVQHTQSKHRCNICGLKSSTSGKLKIHMRTHTNEKPYQCTFCSASFRQLSVLRVHEFTHTKKSSHRCDRCGHFFHSSSWRLKRRKPSRVMSLSLLIIRSLPWTLLKQERYLCWWTICLSSSRLTWTKAGKRWLNTRKLCSIFELLPVQNYI